MVLVFKVAEEDVYYNLIDEDKMLAEIQQVFP